MASSFMVMYDDESVDVSYADGSRLQLSPCGSEYVWENARPAHVHPLQARERVRQRTRFTISKYKALLVDALCFRNRYASRPYLPEELIPANQKETFSHAVCDDVWPAAGVWSTDVVGVCSDGGHARLLLAGCGEEFTVEFTCKSSQNEQCPAPCQEEEHGGIEQNSTAAGSLQELRSTSHPQGLATPAESLAVGRACAHTRVVQHHSRLQHPPEWHHPLSLALELWQRTERSDGIGQLGRAEVEEHHAPGRSPPIAARCRVPSPLPLSCPSPHRHRWRYGDLTSAWAELDTPTELVRVVWCHGIIYRVVAGAVPVVEVSPGDGSVIRSNGVLAEYFTHYRHDPMAKTAVESVYYVRGLPPDHPGQTYSVSSVVTRANRILQAYRQARSSRIPGPSQSCWRVEVIEKVHVMEEVQVAGTGRFQALSNGTAQINFLDGVEVQMLWHTQTPAQQESASIGSAGARAGLCQVSLPDGQQHLLPVHAGGLYQRYVEVSWEWCSWVRQALGVNRTGPAHSNTDQPISNRSVLGELQKIRRFNYLLENSPILNFPPNMTQNCSMTSDLTSLSITDNSVCDALQETSKVIQDINKLLAQKRP